ncbi:MAG: TetR/AcrR family transcriptional regulator [Solirubrobacterales bacterium]|nr:TetR/AcrR family transcriptional regulator [Solirubrobacterales bacterium]
MSSQSSKRRYRKRARAEGEALTRARITEAAMNLHGSVGPAHTTISAVAEQAGVQRGTVYRHFPDEAALFGACSAHWYSLHPPPDGEAWGEIADPDERLRVALGELYAWYGSDEQMFANTFRDAPLVPSMQAPFEAMRAQFEALMATLAQGRRERGRGSVRTLAAIAHAMSFPTWRSLTRDGGLRDEEAVELMLATVAAAADLRRS